MSFGTYTVRDRRGIDRNELPREKASIGFGLFATPRSTGQSDYYRPRSFLGTNTNQLSDYDWKELLGFSRQLFAQMPNVGAAVVQKNIYAVGDAWRPHYKGEDAKWGQEAEEWLIQEWYPNASLRGGVFDFGTELFLSGISYDVDGDDLMILTDDGDTGIPKLQFVSSAEIGSRKSEVKGGEYDGAKMCNGILVDRNKTLIGVNVLGEKPDDDMIISARDGQFLYEPEFRCFHRGVPRMAKAILEAFDWQDVNQLIKRQIKLNSSQGLIKKTVTGEPSPDSDLVVPRNESTDPTAAFAAPESIKVEKILGGEITYLQAGTDEEIKAFEHSTPHANVVNFQDSQERLCMNALLWFFELLNPKDLRGACVRLIQDQARHSIWNRQKTLKKRARRAVQYAVAKAMELGLISKNRNGGDFLKWTFNMPAQITVDAGYDEDADRQNLAWGTTTMSAVTEKKGKFWKDTRRQLVEENINLIECTKQLVTASGGELAFGEALLLMQQRGQLRIQQAADTEDMTGIAARK